MSDGNAPLVEMRDISKDFGHVQALRDVCFSVNRGEVIRWPVRIGRRQTL